MPRYTSTDVRTAAAWVAEHARHVTLAPDALIRWARQVPLEQIRPAARPKDLQFIGTPAEAANWTLLLDSLNFYFWAIDGPLWSVNYAGRRWQRYPALLACLHRAVIADRAWLDASRWAEVTDAQAAALFAGEGEIPLLARRVEIIRESGRVLLEHFGGQAIRLAEEQNLDAPALAARVAELFPSFCDAPSYAGRTVPILKRAQIFAADLAGAFVDNAGPTIRNLEGLTAFADYRIPQTLRHWGIIVLSPELEHSIESGELLEAGGDQEVELRAVSIHAIERMAEALRRERDHAAPAWLVDEYLWERSHDADVTVQHHRTITWYY